MATETFTQWVLESQDGIESLVSRQAEMPTDLEEHEVLVKMYAASLNYRDLAIVMGQRGFESLVISPNVVPGSDGAGVIVSTGKSVTAFVKGNRVVTHMILNFPAEAFPTPAEIFVGLGQKANGTIQEYGVFHESALVHMPKNLSFEEAATLTCSGLTAWNALFGGGVVVRKGDTVLTQGTGGVSIAALQVFLHLLPAISASSHPQFAHAAGATVISTTSTEAKAARLTSLGAAHTLNYKTDLNWGTTAKSLTPDQVGVTNVIDVGGLATLTESLNAVQVEGVITVTGVLGNDAREPPSLLDTLWRVCSVRGIILGSKRQFEDMVKFIEQKDIKPVVDERIFGIHEVKEAYRWIDKQRHFSKVVIKIA
ncbi:Zinc-type alcohol dehydrogenase-like protein [Lachnellula suecica]|uniref:Zinc-type alcohol dehydrogenase-like protein n=1 Tax=Lachnellula suecica TaxID=602035 RepID=A0A8T9C5V6_9HELO|nr:Zinc-type alcohol dehydrogenase-like protein [Lachnellula suecica]